MPFNKKAYDYVVVGGGTAGCIVAARLSEQPDVSVCLIEAGGFNVNPLLKVPALAPFISSWSQFSHTYWSEPEPALGGRRFRLLQGNIMGGASSINGMVYMRGHSTGYDSWQLPGWRFSDLLPCFRRGETNSRGESEWHGGAGPVSIMKGSSTLPICDAFLDAAAAAGYPIVDDLNADVEEGFGYYDFSIRRGVRSGPADDYLKPARRRSNLTVIAEARVGKIVISSGRAAGVELVRARGIDTILAGREVVLCAGAVGSPKLLMLSGIGDPDRLSQISIPVHAEAREVGRNFQNHVRYAMSFRASKPVTGYKYASPAGMLRALAEYGLARKGFLVDTSLSVGGIFRTSSDLPLSDVKLSLVSALPGNRGGMLDLLPREHGFQAVVNQGSPYSRGEIRLKSADPADDPIIATGYLSDPRDLDVLVAGIGGTRELLAHKAMAELTSAEIDPTPPSSSPDELRAEVRKRALNVWHAVGTCRMGTDSLSVVDPMLKVRGVEGLRVADSSVIPVLMNANTYAPAMMVGERAAEILRADSA